MPNVIKLSWIAQISNILFESNKTILIKASVVFILLLQQQYWMLQKYVLNNGFRWYDLSNFHMIRNCWNSEANGPNDHVRACLRILIPRKRVTICSSTASAARMGLILITCCDRYDLPMPRLDLWCLKTVLKLTLSPQKNAIEDELLLISANATYNFVFNSP